MFNIYVNEKKVDLISQSLVLNETLFNIANPSQRNVLFSNDIALAKTSNNIEIFSLLSDNVLDLTYEAKIYWKTVLVNDSVVRIKSINKTTFKIQSLDSLSEFYNNIDKRLYELDFSADDYYFLYTTYTSLRTDLTKSIFWPVVDNRGYGLASSEKLIDGTLAPDLQYFRHSYLVKNVLSEIITNQGYLADLSILTNDLCVTSNHKNFYFTDYQFAYVGQAVTQGNYPTNAGGTLEITSQNNFLQAVGLFEWLLIATPSKFAIEIVLEEDAYLQILKRDITGVTPYVAETHFVDGSARIVLDTYEAGNQIGIQFDRDVTITSLKFISLINEVDYYTATGIIWTNGDTGVVGWERDAIGLPYKYLLEDYYIKSSYNLPDKTQKDFVLEFFKLYNMYFELIDGTITLKQNELGNAIPITLAIEPLDVGKINLSQNNFLKYTNDVSTDRIYPNFAEYNKTYDNESKVESDLIEVKTSASIDVRNTDQVGDEFNVVKIPIYNGVTNIADDRLQQSMRFFLLDDSIAGTSIAADYQGIFQMGLTNNLSFENLYSRFYADYYDYINNAKLKTTLPKLSFYDWLQIRASGKVYYDGREYTVLQINKFNPDRLTELKVISREVE